MQRDVERAHITVLLPDNLIAYIISVDGHNFESDHTEERMVSDSSGSLRLRGWIGPLIGRDHVNELRFAADIGYAREIPVRVMVTSNETGNVSYYAPIVGVMAVDRLALATALIGEGGVLLQATLDTTLGSGEGAASTQPGSGNVQGANAWLNQARGAMTLHFPEQAYRVAQNLDDEASSAAVAAAINQTMPALQNFRNSLK